MFQVSGDCQIMDSCLSSLNYPNNHGNNEHCTVKVLKDIVLANSNIEVETCCDHLVIHGQGLAFEGRIFSDADMPSKLSRGTKITWDSDFSVTGSWQMCFTTPQTHAPVFWQQNRCVDPGYAERAPDSYRQANHWACCERCPRMHGVSKYDTCGTSCDCICESVDKPTFAIEQHVIQIAYS